MISRTFFLITLLVLCPSVIAADWTVFNGLNRDKVSPETGLLKSWKEGGPPLFWKIDTLGTTELPGYGSVTVAEGRIFATGNVRTGSNDQEAHAYIFALDEKTGKELWRYRNGVAWTDKARHPGERGTPTVDGDRLYSLSAMGRVACLETATGKEIWARDLREEYDVELPEWAFAESLFVDGDKIAVWIGAPKAAVVALNKMTGKTIWTTPGTGQYGNYASMLAFNHGGQRIYVNSNRKGFLGVNGETGKQLFYIEHVTPAGDIMATTPHFFDGKLFITSGYSIGSRLYRLDIEGETIKPHQVWSNKQFDNQLGGIVIKDGYVYGATMNYKGGRNWTCMKLEDGSSAWEAPGVHIGSIAYADEMLYCMGEKDGIVALVKATPEKYEESGRFELPEGVGPYWAHPVIANKKLFIRHGKMLYCFDVAEQE